MPKNAKPAVIRWFRVFYYGWHWLQGEQPIQITCSRVRGWVLVRMLAEPRSIINYHVGAYGRVKVKLANLLKTLTGAKYDVITRYYKDEHIAMADLDFCFKIQRNWCFFTFHGMAYPLEAVQKVAKKRQN